MNITLNTERLQLCELVSEAQVPEDARDRFDWVKYDHGFFKLGDCWHHVEEFTNTEGDLRWFSTSATTGVAGLPSYDDDSFFAFNFSV